MAESTLEQKYLFLFDRWPGPIRYDLPPANSAGDTFGNTTHCNVAAAKYDVGTKVAYYDNTNHGWSILTYLKFEANGETNQNIGTLCAPFITTTIDPYEVTADSDTTQFSLSGPAAVMIVAMTDEYFGWFWTGGVAPYEKATAFATAITTGTAATYHIITQNADVAAGSSVVLIDCGTAGRLGIGLTAGTEVSDNIGIALHADV